MAASVCPLSPEELCVQVLINGTGDAASPVERRGFMPRTEAPNPSRQARTIAAQQVHTHDTRTNTHMLPKENTTDWPKQMTCDGPISTVASDNTASELIPPPKKIFLLLKNCMKENEQKIITADSKRNAIDILVPIR